VTDDEDIVWITDLSFRNILWVHVSL